MSFWGGAKENMRKSVVLAVCYAVFAVAVIAWALLAGEAYLLLLSAYAALMALIVYFNRDRSDTGKKSPKMGDSES